MVPVLVLVCALSPSPPKPSAGPPNPSKMPRLLTLSTVPIAPGAYAPAVQLAGKLSDSHALLLQFSTYVVAATAVGAIRVARERSLHVDDTTLLKADQQKV